MADIAIDASSVARTPFVHHYGSLNEETASIDSQEDLPSLKRCSVTEASSNLINVMLGAGVFYLPYTLLLSGWSALLPILLLGLIALYSFSLIAQCIETALQTSTSSSKSLVNITYADLGRLSFGPLGGPFCMLSLSIEFTLAAVSMVINIGVNVHSAFPFLSTTSGIVLSSVLVYLLTFIEDLKQFSKLSSFGNFAIFTAFVFLIISGLQFYASLSPLDTVEFYSLIKPQGLPLSSGLIVFCYGGIGAFPKIYMSLENRSRVFELLLLSGVCIIGAYAAVAFTGYAFYGKYVQMPITSAMGFDKYGHLLPYGRLIQHTATLGIAMNLQLTIPLILFTVKDMMQELILSCSSSIAATSSAQSRPTLLTRLIFFLLVLIIMMAAIFFRTGFATLCSLVGSIATSINSVCLPIFFYHTICYRQITLQRTAMHAFILLLVLSSSVAGITSNICKLKGCTTGLCAFL